MTETSTLEGNRLSQLRRAIISRLTLQSETPELDAQVLLAHVTGKPRSWVMAHPEGQLTPKQRASLDSALQRLESGEPLPHLLGHWEFYGLDFEVSPEVLIPRPETELLVEHALHWLRESPTRRTIADVGTGSGCLAVTLATQVANLQVIATDISWPALQIARRNARRFGVDRRISFVQCDLLPAHPDPLPSDSHFDLICANLPYIPTSTLRELTVFEREPTIALDGGPQGLDLIQRLIDQSAAWLAPGGMILLEIEASQGLAVLSLAYDAFSRAYISLHQDLAGRDRLIEIRTPVLE
jgi:release factor glutamine methyltransferase